jgi:site-specific DNA-methyltransferase (cytosine-N4-specific)
MTVDMVSELEVPQTSLAQIRWGDAFDLIDQLPDQSVDLILTSPPYWGLRSYGLDHQEAVLAKWEAIGCSPSRVPPYDWYRSAGGQLGLEPYPSWYAEHIAEFFSRARRVLRPSGSVWLNLGDTYFARWGSIRDRGRQGLAQDRQRRRTPSGGYLHDKQLLLIPARCAIALQDTGWILRNDLIWSKPNPLPRPERDRLRLSHEHWFHFVRKTPRGRPNYYYDLAETEAGGLDVVTVSTAPPEDSDHSATFPSELIRPRIGSSCPSDGLVLDPFCGTGTVVVEAFRLGRRAIGFEKSAEYAGPAAARVAAEVKDRVLPSPEQNHALRIVADGDKSEPTRTI